LLRQAENHAATRQESEAFLKKATELMAKYGIEQAMLHADRPEADRVADRELLVSDPFAQQGDILLGRIAYALRCRTVHRKVRDREAGRVRRRVRLFGYESDLHRVEVLYASLRLQMLDGAQRASAVHRPRDEDVKAYKRSWMYGFITESTRRIAEVERAAQAEAEGARAEGGAVGRSVEIVLADRGTRVAAEVARAYPKLKKARTVQSRGTGYRQGRIDGERADIGGPAMGSDGHPQGLLSA
jgi:hypothetical protein